MIRPTIRRSLRLEKLESRELLTAGGPSAEAQEMLYLLNLARTNPSQASQLFTQNLDDNVQATVNYYNVNVSQVANAISSSPARAPLAWNNQLANAATTHSQDMESNDYQSHTGSDGSSPQQRMATAGYSSSTVSGENAYAYATSVDQAMEAFMLDWGVADDGHRMNIQQPNASPSQVYQEVGIGIVDSTKSNLGAEVITQDFGTRSNTPAQVVGVAYNDPSHQHLYTMGSGVGNVEIDATNVSTGAITKVQTWDAGGYQIPLAPGTYNITAVDNGQVVNTQRVSVGSQNVDVDFDLSNPWQGGSPPAPTPAPAPTVAIPGVASSAQSLITPASPTAAVTRPWFSGWSSWHAR